MLVLDAWYLHHSHTSQGQNITESIKLSSSPTSHLCGASLIHQLRDKIGTMSRIGVSDFLKSDGSMILRTPTRLSLQKKMHLNLLISGNLTGQIGEELSVDLWENFVSGMSNYPDYDADSISFFKPHEGNKFAVGYFNFLLNTIFVSRYRLLPCPWALPALQ